MGIWKLHALWLTLAKFASLLGSFLTLVLLIQPETHTYIWITASASFLSEIILLFAQDKDGNGIVDWFEWKKFTNLFLFLILLVSFSACNPHARWIKKGHKNGWIDTTTKTSEFSVPALRDTIYVDSIVKEYVATIDTLLQRDSIYLQAKTIEKIIEITRHHFVPKVVRVPFIDTLNTISQDGNVKIKQWTDDQGNILTKITYKKTTIADHKRWYHFWWLIPIGMGIVILLVFLRSRSQ